MTQQAARWRWYRRRPSWVRTPARTLVVLIAVWAPRLVALLIAATLGLLSPLSCVVHCAIHGAAHHEPPTLTAHAGHDARQHHESHHHDAASALPSAPPHRPPPGSEEPITPPTPRAVYEFVSLGSLLVLMADLLVAVLLLTPPAIVRPFLPAPPTPPPRLLV